MCRLSSRVCVDETLLAKKNTIVQRFVVGLGGKLLSRHRLDPFACSMFLFRIALGVDLDKQMISLFSSLFSRLPTFS